MSKLRKSAKGRECTVRIPGVCNNNPETVVLAHLNGGGMGMKRHDIHAAYCCDSCHAWLDGGFVHDPNCQGTLERNVYHYEGVIRTQEIMLREGLIKV